MGPLVLLMFAGHLGLSVAMGNATANETSTYTTCHSANATYQANMTCPHGYNGTHPPHKPPAPEGPKVELKMKLLQTFTLALNNRSSPEFQALAANVTAVLDKVFTDSFGSDYNKSVIKEFSNGSVWVEADLLFNKVKKLPKATEVVNTLVTAVASGNFSLPIDKSSITAEVEDVKPPKNETHPPQKPPAPEGPKVELKMKLLQTFTPALNNPSSPEFQALAANVTAVLDKVFTDSFGSDYNRSVIEEFSNGSVWVEADLLFNKVKTLPKATEIVNTLVTAVASGNFSLPIDKSSITAEVEDVKPPKNETHPTQKPPAPDGHKVDLAMQLAMTFTEELKNLSSPQAQELAANVTTALDKVFSKHFGRGYLLSIVKGFSKGSVLVAAQLLFNNTSGQPNATEIVNALVAAVKSGNFSLPVNASSITATVVTPQAAATTVAPGTAKATAGPATGAPTSSEGVLGLTFSLNQTFNSNLSDTTSTEYGTLANKVVKEINKVCRPLFAGFLRSIVNSFKPGSVKVAMTLIFTDKDSVPSASNATSLISAALAKSNLNVVNGSVSAQAITASGCHPQPSVLSLLASSLAMMAVVQLLVRF